MYGDAPDVSCSKSNACTHAQRDYARTHWRWHARGRVGPWLWGLQASSSTGISLIAKSELFDEFVECGTNKFTPKKEELACQSICSNRMPPVAM